MVDKIREALWRNLNELRYAISMRNCLNEFTTAAPETNWGFFTYCTIALYNDIFSHEIKVLDKHKKAASFWYIRNCNFDLVNKLMEKHNISIEEIEELSYKLKLIRDKTHFHIDKSGVIDPSVIWNEANIKGDYINEIIDKLYKVMNDVYREKYGCDFGQPIHDGKDAGIIVEACKIAGIII